VGTASNRALGNSAEARSAGSLLFVCDDSGMLMAIDASTRKILWSYQTSQQFEASPITYVFDNKQYIALSAGQSIFAFGFGEWG
jgi:alcohol dehydrogenase (cytochrome c)